MKAHCGIHTKHHDDCFPCRKAELKAQAAATTVTAVESMTAPRIEPPGGQFRIECVCGIKTQTRYLTGTCTCGRKWEVEWNAENKKYPSKIQTKK